MGVFLDAYNFKLATQPYLATNLTFFFGISLWTCSSNAYKLLTLFCFYQNMDSVRQIFRALHAFYDVYNRPSEWFIGFRFDLLLMCSS